MEKFKAGEVVRLKSDFQYKYMTVVKTEDGKCECIWNNKDGIPTTSNYPEIALVSKEEDDKREDEAWKNFAK